ncbi:helix-turn-helix domain-containing protein [Moorena producens]|uniref:helix-turn-helix domain-containing protein n=1 Tax=Moorena producens TaxID=1155739 RepID=UPI00268B4766
MSAVKHKAVKVRIYPTQEQVHILTQHFGCARWWWNYARFSLYRNLQGNWQRT